MNDGEWAFIGDLTVILYTWIAKGIANLFDKLFHRNEIKTISDEEINL